MAVGLLCERQEERWFVHAEQHSQDVASLRTEAEGMETSLSLFRSLLSREQRLRISETTARARQVAITQGASEADVRRTRDDLADVWVTIIAKACRRNA